MAVDRRTLRRYPGRKRRGRHRCIQPPLAPKADSQLKLAVCSKEITNAGKLLADAMEFSQAELLQTYSDDRFARIRAVQAVFVLMRVDQLDYIKKFVWIFLDQPATWQFLDEAGWTTCQCSTQEMLNDAERNVLEEVDTQIEGRRYHYNLRLMEQTNCRTGRTRALRRANPWCTVAPLPRWQYEIRIGWADCDLDMQHVLAESVCEAENEQQAVVHRTIRGIDYALDFVALTQTNLSTGRVRALRFAPRP